MFKNSSLTNFQESIIRTTSIAIITSILKMYAFNQDENLFNNTWLFKTIGQIVGYGLFDLFLYKIPEESNLKPNEKSAFKDILYFGSMLFMKEVFVSNYMNRDFDLNIFRNILSIIIMLTVYNLFIKRHIEEYLKRKVDSNTDLVNYSSKIIFGVIIADLIPSFKNEKLSKYLLSNVVILLIALPVYFLHIRPIFEKNLNLN